MKVPNVTINSHVYEHFFVCNSIMKRFCGMSLNLLEIANVSLSTNQRSQRVSQTLLQLSTFVFLLSVKLLSNTKRSVSGDVLIVRVQ